MYRVLYALYMVVASMLAWKREGRVQIVDVPVEERRGRIGPRDEDVCRLAHRFEGASIELYPLLRRRLCAHLSRFCRCSAQSGRRSCRVHPPCCLICPSPLLAPHRCKSCDFHRRIAPSANFPILTYRYCMLHPLTIFSCPRGLPRQPPASKASPCSTSVAISATNTAI